MRSRNADTLAQNYSWLACFEQETGLVIMFLCLQFGFRLLAVLRQGLEQHLFLLVTP